MPDTSKNLNIICELLKAYEVAEQVSLEDIHNFKTYKSSLYGMTSVYSFVYQNQHYYVSDDYLLMDNPAYIRNVLEDINSHLHGKLIQNPVPQTDGAKYALGLNGTEYYLWEVASNKS